MSNIVSKITIGSLLLATLAGCTSTGSVADIPESIANATTPAEHLRISHYFAKKASDYEAEAQQHERMAVAYAGRPRGDAGMWVSHCGSLKSSLTAAAKEARALEKEHRQIALELEK
ncbi:MAG: hypothetical protein AzoDbin1_03792 [Azoarcus sp.]|uniref:Lipoprotein n=1 Tax=Aromatoleum toluolicum TaxID=90060 RepID=A0ABX1NGS3_9RHOO|nr:hypothetical protein [Aromatoleum toluolicum]MCK9987320.1 hypothetical protein [Azoarcus sp.]NMF98459.1 hypothetical protein [Aromatoleum toluolicum]